MSGGQARRVRITSPQTRIALSRRHRPAQHLLPLPEPGSDDEAVTAAARALFAQQRRLAVRTLCLLGGVLLGLSGLLGALPVLDRVTVGGFPASWLLLMAGSYPLLLVIAVLHVRAAEAAERAEERAREQAGERAGEGPGERPVARSRAGRR